ncbi:DNA repair and recombination protein RadB [Methanobacterium paludis]|uniref:DNA repair and recombination protein RadB n=1 Tax=Methanobacterium paludis (strain DSM 25820 / JCM 18151 / SWAN1) TaxID=868131 RepID=F6D3Y3_METPW|nr:DNA repair and recombination protein RadB [Methanobacterium paludis]AEG18785.1 DNA repair and recombination protein radB [Methanobacterium paludis]
MKFLGNLEENGRIITNSPIDSIIGGGVEKGCVTQFYGPPGSGKTNIVLQLLVQCARNGDKAIFVDTEGGLSIERVKQISGDDFDKFATKIMIFEPTTFKEQDDVLRKLETFIDSKTDRVELIVLDSAVALYRLKDGDSTQMNRELGKQMASLSRIARKHHIAVVVTNHIYSVFEGDGMIEPVGGTILKYWSKIMVEIARVNGSGERFAILKRHRSRPEGLRARFRIVDNGLE